MKRLKNSILEASSNWIATIADDSTPGSNGLKTQSVTLKHVNRLMKVITAEELNARMEDGETLHLIDVREPFESNISDFKVETLSLPFETLGDHLTRLDKETEYIVYCRSGNTSQKATKLLQDNGFEHVKNLEGGINGWSQKFDPSLPQY